MTDLQQLKRRLAILNGMLPASRAKRLSAANREQMQTTINAMAQLQRELAQVKRAIEQILE